MGNSGVHGWAHDKTPAAPAEAQHSARTRRLVTDLHPCSAACCACAGCPVVNLCSTFADCARLSVRLAGHAWVRSCICSCGDGGGGVSSCQWYRRRVIGQQYRLFQVDGVGQGEQSIPSCTVPRTTFKAMFTLHARPACGSPSETQSAGMQLAQNRTWYVGLQHETPSGAELRHVLVGGRGKSHKGTPKSVSSSSSAQQHSGKQRNLVLERVRRRFRRMPVSLAGNEARRSRSGD